MKTQDNLANKNRRNESVQTVSQEELLQLMPNVKIVRDGRIWAARHDDDCHFHATFGFDAQQDPVGHHLLRETLQRFGEKVTHCHMIADLGCHLFLIFEDGAEDEALSFYNRRADELERMA